MITKDEVKHIAKLARLGLTEQEIEKFQKDLSAILDYVEKLKEVDVEGIEPTSHSVLIENITRGDEIKNQQPATSNQKLLALAPETKDGFIKVKSVF